MTDGRTDGQTDRRTENTICRAAWSQLKTGKSTGPDHIPNETLKQEGIQILLLSFINVCFQYSIIPSVWNQADISLIPKSATKDPYAPLNYRGISLISCMYKLYPGLINQRLTSLMERGDLLVDEQNGFREGRSCQDHVYVLSSIIRNRNTQNLSTYAAFEKAFDWVDRDLMFYKLASQFGLGGKIYNAIKSLYDQPTARVIINESKLKLSI